METGELVSQDIILAEVLVRVDDEPLRKGLTRGWYYSQIQQAMEKMAMKVFFDEQPPLNLPMPTNGRWQLPDNFFNIQQLYAFNGNCCDVGSSANIYFKRNFNNAPNGNGYTSLNKGSEQSGNDPFFWATNSNVDPIGGGNSQLFANVQNGFLMFSTSCLTYGKFRIIYNGFGGKIGQKPLIPRNLRGIITDLTTLAALETLMVKFPKSVYGAQYDRIFAKIYNKSDGTMWDAERWIKQASRWKKDSREIYLNNYGNW